MFLDTMKHDLERLTSILGKVGEPWIRVPSDHNPDCPVVVPYGNTKPIGENSYVLASVVAFKPGERVAAKSRTCMHCIWNNSVVDYASGVFACEESCPVLVSDRPLPPMIESLRTPHKEWTVFLSKESWEKPYTRLKNWEQGDLNFEPKSPTYCPATSYAILRKWDDMESKDCSWKERMAECLGPMSGDEEQFKRAINGFQKYCNSLGLNKGHKCNLDDALAGLSLCIDVAKRVFD